MPGQGEGQTALRLGIPGQDGGNGFRRPGAAVTGVQNGIEEVHCMISHVSSA